MTDEIMPFNCDDPRDHLAGYYEQIPGGWALTTEGRRVRADNIDFIRTKERELADKEAELKASAEHLQDVWTRSLFRRAVNAAVTKLRIQPVLRDVAAAAMLRELTPITVTGPEQPVMVATESGAVPVVDAVETWLRTDEGKPFRPGPEHPKANGHYTAKLAVLKQGLAH